MRYEPTVHATSSDRAFQQFALHSMFMRPDYLEFSAWHEHMPFAFWLIEALRPRVFVELGTHYGVSYFAFCQAVERLGLNTSCFAIDTFAGDEHASFYGEDVFEKANAHNEERYSGFSRLVRSSFDEALEHFSDGSIDLLHIDGLHTLEAVRHDFESWLPKLSERGVVVLHDSNVRERDFGVSKLLEELRGRYPCFEFVHCHGLAVVGVGSSQSDLLVSLFEADGNELLQQAVRSMFSQLGHACSEAFVAKAARSEAQGLRAQLGEAQQARDDQLQQNGKLHDELDGLKQSLADQRRQRDELLQEFSAIRLSFADKTELNDVHHELGAISQALADHAGDRNGLRSGLDRTERLLTEQAARHDTLQGDLAAALQALAEYSREQDRLRNAVTVLNRSSFENISIALRPASRTVREAGRAIRRTLTRIAFHSSGKPRKLVRRALFRSNGAVRATTRVLVQHKNGRPRRAFRRWMTATQQPTAEPIDPPLRPGPHPTAHAEPVDIIICVHNALDEVRDCLASVRRCTAAPYQFILVDDGSNAETAHYLQEFATSHGAKLIRHTAAKGYTLAANAGLLAASASYCVLLNSDTEVTTGWLDRMMDQMRIDLAVGIVGPMSNTASWQSAPLVEQSGDWAENPLPAGLTADDMARLLADGSARLPIHLGFINGFCLLLRGEMIRQIGIFDEVNFAAGYGEENDYCIRARKAGWRLVVAEDAYVYHRQSRSYGHERRLVLAAKAGAALAAKHDERTDISPYAEHCRDSLLLHAARLRLSSNLFRDRLVAANRGTFAARSIAFVLPVGGAGGGANVVHQEVRALRRLGVDSWIVNLACNRSGYESEYPDNDLPVFYFDPDVESLEAFLGRCSKKFDAVVATAFSSFYWLPEQDRSFVLGYYIQDMEHLFFEDMIGQKAEQDMALETHVLREDVKRVTKSAWNRNAILDVNGRAPVVIGPSVDLDRFRPLSDAGLAATQPIRVTAMVRPSSQRRSPDLTLRILSALKKRFGDRVSVSFFGCDPVDIRGFAGDLSGVTAAGKLTPSQVAGLLGNSDVFLDLSTWQAMGLTALEAMASGVAVIVPRRGGATEFCVHEDSGLVMDTDDEEACLAGAQRLVEDRELRLKLRHRAMEVAHAFPPEIAALNLLDILFSASDAQHQSQHALG